MYVYTYIIEILSRFCLSYDNYHSKPLHISVSFYLEREDFAGRGIDDVANNALECIYYKILFGNFKLKLT